MHRRFCLTLDLKDDPKLIAEYKRYHEQVWPEIVQSIKDSGILESLRSFGPSSIYSTTFTA